jgi:hypothetical protein
MIGMTKREVDRWFSSEHDYVNTIAHIVVKRYNRNYDPSDLVSEAYLVILDKLDKLRTTNDLKYYVTSVINLIGSDGSSFTRSFMVRHVSLDGHDVENTDEYNVERDQYVNKKKATLIRYRNNLKCSVERTIFDVYYFKGIQTCRGMGEYFNLHRDTAMRLIKDLKTNIQNYEKTI